MSDISFKISGTSAPFLARVWNATCTTLKTSKYIEYSGETIQIGSLSENTPYNLSVTDRIGNIVWSGFTTPVTPPEFTVVDLPDITLSIVGTPYSPVPPYVCAINAPKYICVEEGLSEGQYVCFDMDIITCCVANTTNTLIVKCMQCGTTTYNTIISDENTGCYTYRFRLNYGDSMCYDMASVIDNGTLSAEGYSCLEIVGTTGYSANASIGDSSISTAINYNVTTTTTTTTLTPVGVCMTNHDVTPTCNSTIQAMYITAGLKTSRCMVAGESFRLSFINCAYGWKTEISQYAFYDCAWVNNVIDPTYCEVSVILIPPDITSRGAEDGRYIDVTCNNIDNIRFYACINTHTVDDTINSYNCAVSQLTNISNKVGANFTLNSVYDRVGIVADFRDSCTINGICPICCSCGPTSADGFVTRLNKVIE